MGSVAAAGGGTPTVAWSSIAYSAVDEGQQNTVNINLTYWDNTDVYWYLVDTGGSAISNSTQVSPNAGVLQSTGTGSSSQSFNFTFNNDATTDGELTYYVRIENVGGTLLIPRQGPFTCNDTSLAPTYTLANGGGNTVNEGSQHTLNVGGTNVPGGTYYWTIETNAEDFAVTSGSVTVSSGTGGVLGSFTVTPTADATTEGTEQFTVSLRSGSITGTILATSQAANINDTSLTPTYTVAPVLGGTNVDEGSGITFEVGGTNITDGTYYWTIETNSGDFVTTSGAITMTSNAGTFIATPRADASISEGSETFTVAVRSGSISGTILVTSDPVTINDTSVAVAPFSLVFNTPQEDFLRVSASSDWNLGNTWTMEFWIKANNASNAGINIPGGQWGLINQGGWYTGMSNDNSILVGLAGGKLTINQSASDAIEFAEPTVGGAAYSISNPVSQGGWGDGSYSGLATTGGTGTGLTVDGTTTGGYLGTPTINNPGSGYSNGDTITVTGPGGGSATFTIATTTRGVWTHVAVVNDGGGSAQKVYYNGVEQAKVAGSYTTNGKTNTSDDIYIGRLAPNYASYFDGQLAMVRISNAAKYSTAFTPSTTYGVAADTKLFLGSDTPLVDLSYYELNGVTTVASNSGTLYFSKSTYPNLDKQIQIGNTVVNADTSDSATVTAAVFTPDGDPGNWGVNYSPAFMTAVYTANFSGSRHTVVNNGVTLTTAFPNTYTVRQWLGGYTGGGSNSGLFVLLADYPDAAAIPAGATAIIGGAVKTVISNSAGLYGGTDPVRQFSIEPDALMARGITVTFTW